MNYQIKMLRIVREADLKKNTSDKIVNDMISLKLLELRNQDKILSMNTCWPNSTKFRIYSRIM